MARPCQVRIRSHTNKWSNAPRPKPSPVWSVVRRQGLELRSDRRSSQSPRLDPPANASLPASRGSDPQRQAAAVWSPRFSQQHSAQPSPAGPGLSRFSARSRSQASQDQGLGHLLSLPPNPRLLGARPGSAREMPVLQEKALPRLLCILSLAEARATGQRQEGLRRKHSAYIRSLHVGCKKEASLIPPGRPGS